MWFYYWYRVSLPRPKKLNRNHVEGHKWSHRPFPLWIPQMLPWQAWMHSQERDEQKDCSLVTQETSCNTKECGITEQTCSAPHWTYFANDFWEGWGQQHGTAGWGDMLGGEGVLKHRAVIHLILGCVNDTKYLQRLSPPQPSEAGDTRLNYKQVTWDTLKAGHVLEYHITFSPSSSLTTLTGYGSGTTTMKPPFGGQAENPSLPCLFTAGF